MKISRCALDNIITSHDRESPLKTKCRLSDCICRVGLWCVFWIALTDVEGHSPLWAASSPRSPELYKRCSQEQASKQHPCMVSASSSYCTSGPDCPQGKTMIRSCEPNKPSPPQVGFGDGVCRSNKQETKTFILFTYKRNSLGIQNFKVFSLKKIGEALAPTVSQLPELISRCVTHHTFFPSAGYLNLFFWEVLGSSLNCWWWKRHREESVPHRLLQ